MIPLAAINQLAAVYRGRGRNEAYLEFAQEHFLDWLRLEGLFEDDAVVFKGGTAIRKFILGNGGRFSTDLDFAVEDPIYADHILERLAQRVTHQGVTFVLDKYDAAARKGTWLGGFAHFLPVIESGVPATSPDRRGGAPHAWNGPRLRTGRLGAVRLSPDAGPVPMVSG